MYKKYKPLNNEGLSNLIHLRDEIGLWFNYFKDYFLITSIMLLFEK